MVPVFGRDESGAVVANLHDFSSKERDVIAPSKMHESQAISTVEWREKSVSKIRKLTKHSHLISGRRFHPSAVCRHSPLENTNPTRPRWQIKAQTWQRNVALSGLQLDLSQISPSLNKHRGVFGRQLHFASRGRQA